MPGPINWPPGPPPPNIGGPKYVNVPGPGGGRGGSDFGMPGPSYPVTTRSLQVWHPWLYPFPGSTDFRINDVAASAGVGTITPAVWSFKLPGTSKGVIRLVTWAIANLAVASVVQWTLRINQQPVPGWQNLTVFPGNVPRVTLSDDAIIPVPQGGTIDVAFTNTDGAAYPQVSAGFAGHFWDQVAEDAWMGQGATPG